MDPFGAGCAKPFSELDAPKTEIGGLAPRTASGGGDPPAAAELRNGEGLEAKETNPGLEPKVGLGEGDVDRAGDFGVNEETSLEFAKFDIPNDVKAFCMFAKEKTSVVAFADQTFMKLTSFDEELGVSSRNDLLPEAVFRNGDGPALYEAKPFYQ
jgi:hypothetical protein